MKYAVYTVTRNKYEDVIPSVKSLLINSDVDKVYMLIEDDKFQVELPQECECINVSEQKYFRPFGPNIIFPYSYMAMMRAALYDVLPDVDVVLSLDIDTIIDGDISALWDVDIDNYYLAAAKEPKRSTDKQMYVNTGVALYNLAKLRDGMGDKVVKALNNRRFYFYEQDAFNELCAGNILELPSKYNSTDYTEQTDTQLIVHYAGVRDWAHNELMDKYRNIPWGDIRKPVIRKKKRTRPTEWGPEGREYYEML